MRSLRPLRPATTLRCLLTLLCLLCLLAPPALARGNAPTDPVLLAPSLVSQTSFVEQGGLFELVLDTSEVPPDARVELVVRDRVLGRSEFGLSVTGDRLRSTRFTMSARPFAEVDGFDDDRARFEVRLGRDLGQAALVREGVYPVEVRVFDPQGVRIGGINTHLVLLPPLSEEPRPIAVALIAEVGLDPVMGPDGESRPIETESARLARAIESLAAHADVPLAIAARPETVEALAEAGGINTTAALLALRDAVPGRQVISLPYVDLDVAAMLAAGLDGELDAQLDRGARQLADELGVVPDRSVWLAGPTLDRAAAETLAERGRTSFVVTEGRVAPVDASPGLSLTRTFGLPLPGPSPIAAKADAVLGFRLLDETDPELSAHTVLAELAVLSLEEPLLTRGVVIQPPGGALPPVETLDILLDALSEPNSLVTPVTLDQFFGQVEVLAGVEPEFTPDPPIDLTRYASDLRDTRRLLTSYATMTAAESERTEPFDRLLDTGAARSLTATDRSRYVATARRGITDALGAVSISDARVITLTDRRGSVPLTLRNDSGAPLDVAVTLDSERLEFPNGEVLDLTLTGEITRVDVAVRTRASGSFPLRITVTSPDGALELAATKVTIRSTAVSGVGVFLSIGALVILLVWWARDWRSGRRDQRLVERPPGERTRLSRPESA